MLNEVLKSRAIAFFLGLWAMYCASIGAYDGALFIPLIYGGLLLLNHFDNKKDASAANTDAQNK